jgi:hypothetical protein
MAKIITLATVLACLACGGIGSAFADDEDYEADFSSLMAPGGYLVVFYDATGTLSYVTPSLKDLPPGVVQAGRVQGRACQYGLSIPTSLAFRAATVSAVKGNGSYQEVLAAIHVDHPEMAGFFDVIVDKHTRQVLGFFKRVCTEVTARGYTVPDKTPD